jgi:hypothetical protein
MALHVTYPTARLFLDDLVERGDLRLVQEDHARRQWTLTAQGLSRAQVGDWAPPIDETCDLWPALLRLFVVRDRRETRARAEAEQSRAALEARLTPAEKAEGARFPPLPPIRRDLRVVDAVADDERAAAAEAAHAADEEPPPDDLYLPLS